MGAVQKIQKWQTRERLDNEKAAKKLGISEFLFSTIMDGGVTHPKIVEKIQKTVGLSELEAEELLPKHRRKHGGDYEPDRYQIDENVIYNKF